MKAPAIAHTANDYGKVDLLHDHLQAVADRAAEFTSAFGAEEEACMAGILHDSGKYGSRFQRRLQGLERGVDHWAPGAWTALMKYQLKGVPAALAIAGHHVGLGSLGRLQELNPTKLNTHHPLNLKLSTASEGNPVDLLQQISADGLFLPDKDLIPDSLFGGPNSPSVAAMLDVRMLFSALVDADFLETEAHFQGNSDGEKQYRKPAWNYRSPH